jgi:hypothetical protein
MTMLPCALLAPLGLALQMEDLRLYARQACYVCLLQGSGAGGSCCLRSGDYCACHLKRIPAEVPVGRIWQ